MIQKRRCIEGFGQGITSTEYFCYHTSIERWKRISRNRQYLERSRTCPQVQDDFQTFHAGHEEVQHNERGLGTLQVGQCRVPITGFFDRVALGLKELSQPQPNLLVVIHD